MPILSSNTNADQQWRPFENEFPIPFTDILICCALTDECKIGYYDPILNQISLTVTPLDRTLTDEGTEAWKAHTRCNVEILGATHWKYITETPAEYYCKTADELLDEE